MSEWGERRHKSPNDAKRHSLRPCCRTRKSNSRIPLNKRICKREPSFQVGSLSCIRSIQYSRYISPISFQIFFSFNVRSLCSRGDEEVPRMALRVLRPKSPHSEEWAQYIEQNLSSVRSLRFAFLSMFRLPKHFCAHWSQHLPCRCFSLFIAPEWYSGAFSRKSTFLKWRSASDGTSSIAPEKSPLWGMSAIHRMAYSSRVRSRMAIG